MRAPLAPSPHAISAVDRVTAAMLYLYSYSSAGAFSLKANN